MTELAHLVSALRFFRGPLDRAMGEEKGEFFAFMVGRELPLLQSRLIEETDHWDIYLQNKERTNKDIKNIAEANLRLALDEIPPTAQGDPLSLRQSAHILEAPLRRERQKAPEHPLKLGAPTQRQATPQIER
jgi:hypothetical protein